MSFGLSKREKDTIADILKKYPQVSLVYLFGSRATGNYKPGSDIDLAIMNSGVYVVAITINGIKISRKILINK